MGGGERGPGASGFIDGRRGGGVGEGATELEPGAATERWPVHPRWRHAGGGDRRSVGGDAALG